MPDPKTMTIGNIILDGEKGSVSTGGNQQNGSLVIKNRNNVESASISTEGIVSGNIVNKAVLKLGNGRFEAEGGDFRSRLVFKDSKGQAVVALSTESSGLSLGGLGNGGKINLHANSSGGVDNPTAVTVVLDGEQGAITIADPTNTNQRKTVVSRTGLASTGAITLNNTQTAGLVSLDGATGNIRASGDLSTARITMLTQSNKEAIKLDAKDSSISLNDSGGSSTMLLEGKAGRFTIKTSTGKGISILAGFKGGMLNFSPKPDDPVIGTLALFSDKGSSSILTSNGNLLLGAGGGSGLVALHNQSNKEAIKLEAKDSSLSLNDSGGSSTVRLDGNGGGVTIKSSSGKQIVGLTGFKGGMFNISPKPDDPIIGTLALFSDKGSSTILTSNGNLLLGAGGGSGLVKMFNSSNKGAIELNAQKGHISLSNSLGVEQLLIDGENGDIIMQNADCAEDFDITDNLHMVAPGTVMVLGDDGKLCPSSQAFDKRVAGVVSGAGQYKPGIVLDRQKTNKLRLPIALIGKVYCKVDASQGAIQVGDLLTTSPTPGHAMLADDPIKAFGAILGKALKPLAEGCGLIPVLVTLL